jgi:hypothetical protein
MVMEVNCVERTDIDINLGRDGARTEPQINASKYDGLDPLGTVDLRRTGSNPTGIDGMSFPHPLGGVQDRAAGIEL